MTTARQEVIQIVAQAMTEEALIYNFFSGDEKVFRAKFFAVDFGDLTKEVIQIYSKKPRYTYGRTPQWSSENFESLLIDSLGNRFRLKKKYKKPFSVSFRTIRNWAIKNNYPILPIYLEIK